MAKSPVPPEHDVALVTPPDGRMTTVWWEWLQRYVRWDEACCEAGGGGEGGAVTSVVGTPPVVVSGTALFDVAEVTSAGVVTVSMPAATASVNGYLTAANWTTFNGKAPLASPVFTGDPQAPTASAGDNDTSIATTAFVQSAVATTFTGGMSTAEYTYSTTVGGTPSTGQLRANTTTQNAITAFYLHETNAVGVDITNALKLILGGVKVLVQDKTNAANVQYYVTTGPAVDNGVYFTIPVAWTSTGSGSSFTAGRVIFAGFGIGSNNMAEAPTDGQIYGRRGSDASWQVAGGAGSYLPLTGGTLSGNLTISAPTIATLTLDDTGALSGTNAALVNWKRGGTNRFAAFLDIAETGSNAGSNLSFARYNDAGTFLSVAAWIRRSDGEFVATAGCSVMGALSVGGISTFLQQAEFKQIPTVNGVAMAGLAFPASDNCEYVAYNGAWRLKGQPVSLAGSASTDITVPSGARMVRIRGICYAPNTTVTQVVARASLDGTTFLAGAADYYYAGLIHYTGSGAYANLTPAGAAYLHLSMSGDNVTVPHQFEARLQIVRPSTSNHWNGFHNSSAYYSAASASYTDTQHRTHVMLTNAGSVLDIKKLRFYLSGGGNFATGSYLDLEWVY